MDSLLRPTDSAKIVIGPSTAAPPTGAADAGVHTFTNVFMLRTRGKQTLTATDKQNSALTAIDSINVT